MKDISVIKIGGNVIDNPQALKAFVERFAAVEGPKILIHGGGKEATRFSQALGVETTMIAGRRVTDRATLDIVTMVYAGGINKRITAMLQGAGCNAIGLCGADAAVVPAVRRRPEPIDYGYVGDIEPSRINAGFIASLLEQGITPVFCAITYDGEGGLLNSNADSVASAVAIATSRIAKTHLTFCFEKPGVLTNVNDPSSVIRYINPDTFRSYVAAGLISDGMIPKIDNAFKAIRSGVETVTIKSADDLLADAGTQISA